MSTYVADLAFTPVSEVEPCPDRPGLKRVKPSSIGPRETFDVQPCEMTDMAQDSFVPDLLANGFDTADISSLAGLQEVLERCRQAGWVEDEDVAAIRSAIDGATLELGGGRTITVQFVSDDGLFMRKAGPNGLKITGEMGKVNDHGAAVAVHADQDVLGTPLVQLMEGRAPELFHHEAPDSSNDSGSMNLLNVWIPLSATVRPLVLADSTTIDRPKHQLRYGILVDGFLEREESSRINDIWSFLYDEAHEWYFRSDMTASTAYVFDTLSTAHGSVILPGEDVAEKAYLALGEALDALANGDVEALRGAVADFEAEEPEVATPALRVAITEMHRLIAVAEANAQTLCAEESEATAWITQAEAARSAVERKSIELRIVASSS